MTDETSDKKWYVEAIKSLGIPTVFLGIMTYGIWTAGAWAGTQIIMPLFQKQSMFIDKATVMIEDMNQATVLINKTLEAHGQHSIETLKTTQEIKDTVMETSTDTKLIQKNHEQLLEVLKNIEKNTEPIRTQL